MENYDVVVKMIFGSHLYGTNTPESDMDFKQVHLPSGKDILLQRVCNSKGEQRNKAEGEKNTKDDIDQESYSLQYFLKLAADGETLTVDMLYCTEDCIIYKTPLWDEIVRNRDKIINRKCKGFVGYCKGQAAKYGIKGSRVAAMKKALDFFSQELVHHGNTAKINQIPMIGYMDKLIDEHTNFVELEVNKVGDKEWFIECCGRKIGFNNTIKNAVEVFTKIYDAYGSRAKKAADNEGIDWKAVSHAVRVAEEAIELLTTGHVTFPLKNARYITAIKQGKLPYSEVGKYLEDLLEKVEAVSESSSLREKTDSKWVEDIVTREYFKRVVQHDSV